MFVNRGSAAKADDETRIPPLVWQVANSKLTEVAEAAARRRERRGGVAGGGGGPTAVVVRKFRYDAASGEWSGGAGASEERNLFLEHCAASASGGAAGGASGDFISVSFGDGRARGGGGRGGPSSSPPGTGAADGSYSYLTDPMKEGILRRGIRAPDGGRFHLLGCSNSQIRECSFLFRRAGSLRENERIITKILPGLEQLERKKGVAKRVKYVGLLFSGVSAFVELPARTRVREIASFEHVATRADFTDGCGLMSVPLARLIKRQMNLPEIPTVVQIRYGGTMQTLGCQEEAYLCKGVLLLDPTETSKYVLSFRRSQLKVQLASGSRSNWAKLMNSKLGILEVSRRMVGKLNQQLVCLLSATVPRADLLNLQDFHLQMVLNCWHNPFSAGYLAAMDDSAGHNRGWLGYSDLVLRSSNMTKGGNRLPSHYVTMAQRRNRFCNENGKLQIHLGCSRLVFGASFPEFLHDTLDEGQCLFFTEQGLLVATVIVSRSPSYCTGDIRVLEAVDLPTDSPLRILRNCIIFSTRGGRPEADKMSGGDLDGDQFLVIWDDRLIRHAGAISQEEPECYDPPPKPDPPKGGSCPAAVEQREDWISFAARFDNSMLGVVDSAFNAIAKERGVKSDEARELNRLFGNLVDKNPASLKRLENLVGSCYLPLKLKSRGGRPCVWEDMIERQVECAMKIRAGKVVPDLEDYGKFRDLLDPSGLLQLQERIFLSRDHFESCVNKSNLSGMLSELSAYVRKVEIADYPSLLKGGGTDSLVAVDGLLLADHDKEFAECCKTWELRAEEVFAAPIAEWEVQRQGLMRNIEHERNLKQKQMKSFDCKRLELNQKRWKCKSALKLIEKGEAELDEQIVSCERQLSEVTGQLNSLSVFSLFSQHRYDLLDNLKELERKLDGLKISASGIMERSEHVEKILRKWDSCVEDLDDQQEAFLNGEMRNELQFEVDKAEQDIQCERGKLRVAEQKKVACENDINRIKEEEKGIAASLKSHEAKASKLKEFRSRLEGQVGKAEGYFSQDMLSASSFASLQRIGQKFRQCDNDFYSCLHDALNDVSIMETRRPKNTRRSECPSQLNFFFACAVKARNLINSEEAKQQSALSALSNEIDKLKAASQHTANRIKRAGKDLNKINREMKKTDISEEDTDEMKGREGQLQSQKQRDEADLHQGIKQLKKNEKEVKNIQMFLKLCQDYRKEAKPMLKGELVGLLPESIFVGLRDIFDDVAVAPQLKRKFESLMATGGRKTKNGSFLIPDPQIFFEYRNFIGEAEKYQADQMSNILEKISGESRMLRDMSDKRSQLEAHHKDLQVSCTNHAERICELDVALDPRRQQLREFFSAARLESLEQQWQDTGFEDSMGIGMMHIDRIIEAAKSDWARARIEVSTMQLKEVLSNLNDEVLRVCWIEENRVNGFPANGKDGGERKERLLVYDKRADLKRVLLQSNCVVITAGTGCGKSTQLPQYIADDLTMLPSPIVPDASAPHDDRGIGRKFIRICCTQPRRVAAQGVSTRVALEYKTEIGDLVGYRVGMRGENALEARKVGANTRIEFVTEGWLLYHLTKSPESINHYDCIIVDEAHERNKETDLLLAFLRRHSQKPDAPSLKVIVMSASIDPTKFCEYLGDCPTIDCPGKMFEVKEYYSPAMFDEQGGKAGSRISTSHVVRVLFEHVLEKFDPPATFEPGDCLIFLTGSKQIEDCVEKINHHARKHSVPVVAYPLYSQMDRKDQDAATNQNHRSGIDGFSRKNRGYVRKVICSTNVAETSLTIDGVRFILEGGHVKKLRYDHSLRCNGLREEMISKASAKQRRGRAGRTASGHCFYLYSREAHEQMRDYDTPQILETPVHELILYSLDVCGRSIEDLGLLDCPKAADIEFAKERLHDLGMIAFQTEHSSISLTDDGKLACRLSSIDPEGVRMALASRNPELNCLHRALKLAAIMSSDDDFFAKSFRDDDDLGDYWMHDLGDHLLALTLFEEFEKRKGKKGKGRGEKGLRNWCKENGLIYHVMNRIQGTVETSYREMKKRKFLASHSEKELHDGRSDERLLRACIAGYFSQVAECNEPSFCKGVSFTMLTPTVLGDSQDENDSEAELSEKALHQPSRRILHLAKESCLVNLMVDEPEAECYILDDDAESEQATLPRVSINFVLFGSLLSILTRRGPLLLMQNASMISGRWIAEHAPESWKKRVQFDPDKPSVCRETIPNVGTPLMKCVDTWTRDNSENLSVVVRVLWKTHQIRLYGSQESMGPVKESILSIIEVECNHLIHADSASSSSNAQKVAFPQQIRTVFGHGLTLKSVEKKHNQAGIPDLCSWFSATKLVHRNKLEGVKNWNTRQQGDKLIIFVNRGWGCEVFQGMLLNIIKHQHEDKRQLQQDNEDVKVLQALSLIGEILYDASNEEDSSRLCIIQEIILRLSDCADIEEDILSLILHRIGHIFLTAGQFDRALNFFKGQPLLTEKKNSSAQEDIAAVLDALGLKYRQRGDYLSSLEIYSSLVKIKKEILGTGHVDVASALHNMGEVLSLCGSLDRAMVLYEEALKIRFKKLGAGNVLVSDTRNDMGVVHLKNRQMEKALKCFEEALRVRELHDDDEKVAETLHNLGLLHRKQSECGKAMEYFNGSLLIRRREAYKSTAEGRYRLQETLYEVMTLAYANQDQFSAIISRYKNEARELFPSGVYKLKVKAGKIEAQRLDDIKKRGKNCLVDVMSKDRLELSPEIVSTDSLPSDLFDLLEKIGIDKFSKTLWVDLWRNIGSEWMSESQFWRTFCAELETKSPVAVSIYFIPSRSQFEIYGCQSCSSKHVKEKLLQNLMLMCVNRNCIEYRPAVEKYSRSQLWQIISVVDELRLRHPFVRFSINLKMSNDSIQSHQQIENNEAPLCRSESALPQSSCRDFDLIEEAYRNGDHVLDLVILLQSPSGLQELEAAHHAISKEFSPQDVTTKPSGPACCMCRRSIIEQQLWKNAKNIKQDKEGSSTGLYGWRLALCGCVFCRQCFFNAILSKLKNNSTAQCQRCSSSVLARDCLSIVKPKNLRNWEKDQFNRDWECLSNLVVSNYCADLAAVGDGRKGSTTCPDCATTALHNSTKPFFYCRNSKCPNLMCSSCGKVPLTGESFERCRSQRCL